MSVGSRSATKQCDTGGTCLARIALLRLESRLHPADMWLGTGEVARKLTSQIGINMCPRIIVAETCRVHEDVQPEPVEQCFKRFADAVRVDMVIPTLGNQRAAQLDRCIQTLHVQSGSAFAVGLALLRLAEEGEPNGQFAAVADATVKMRVDDSGKLSVGLKIGALCRIYPSVAKLSRQMGQRGDQHRILGLEVKIHQAKRQPGDTCDGGQRGSCDAISADRGDRRVDQLPLSFLRRSSSFQCNLFISRHYLTSIEWSFNHFLLSSSCQSILWISR